MKLYEINKAIEDGIEMGFDPETGEIIDEEMLNALQMERDEKIEGIACYIKNLKAEADALKAEKKKLADRQSAAEKKAENLKNYLISCMSEGEKFKTPKVSLSWRASTAVNVTNAEELDPIYTKVEVTPDKTLIKAALDRGENVKGAELVTKQNLQIK